MVAILEKRQFKDFDWLTALIAVAIVSFGVWQIYNAQPTDTYWSKQILGLFIALVAMVVVALSDYRRIVDAAPFFYALGIILLILVLIPGLGVKINGQRAWLAVPMIGRFQPSEFVKIPVVLMLAKYFGNRKPGPLRFREMIVGGLILALPLGLILLEPDAGQAITYFPLLAVVLFLSAVRIRYVILALVAAMIFIPTAYVIGVNTGAIKNYQRERIEAILDPENADPRGFGYHTHQSMITVGKGGLTGIKGNQDISQSVLKFLPEPHTDFIFAVTAENTGFLGCISLLLAYALLISRLVAGAREAPDRVGMLVIMSIAGGITFQIFINVGMVLGFLPVIGVPLPLMSAGLSAVLSTFIAIGFVISVKMRRFVN
ncbi:MAG: rod shape-determining protein RodA [Acidobacteria bacterium]|nr:MAG: rod shape-determining protein RodA [Acidobacteriota bacterium]REK02964.1 MAG: rod shape-determining protein RodA [Acidobacteriota bacterium]REK13232.1 MAG: rod shape-determining protein RodA [Acidobacteriota bacterium]REK41226.1 MAG: rod shape-determining protein RodA [Acidobacteriota bacterium]